MQLTANAILLAVIYLKKSRYVCRVSITVLAVILFSDNILSCYMTGENPVS